MSTTTVDTITTKLGSLAIRATSATHIFVETTREGVTINNVPYRVTAHFEPFEGSGHWVLQRDGLYMRRTDRWRDDYPTDSARKKFVEALTLVVNRWVAANTKAIVDAERTRLDEAIDAAEATMRELHTKIDEQRGAILSLRLQRDALG